VNTRLFPHELAFPPAFESELFPRIRAAIESSGGPADVPDLFLVIPDVQEGLRLLAPEDEGPGQAAASAVQYGALLFHGYRHWLAERFTLVLEEALTRELLGERPTMGAWTLVAPGTAGYVRLPRNLLWARMTGAAPPEAVDGFFWSLAERGAGQEAAPAQLDLLLTLGLHPGRAGFSVIELSAPLPAPPPGHWGDLVARTGTPDFANILPGGELRGLHALESAAEALKLASRIFHHFVQQPQRSGGT
jgi:hypothetical protein